jgi:hypothetical protein
MHFTYKEPDATKLKQGDILKKTPALLALIEEVHPHYANDDYLYFQVLTQSCDLVKRDGACKTRYITLAAVRSFDLIITRAVEAFADQTIVQDKVFCSERHKKSLEDVFNKLLNNNDTQHFYLEACPEHQLPIPCCTQLHLSISIRAYQHFDVCLEAKILELDESFRAKLGWLVGNLYSRIGTTDYVPGAIPDNETYQNHIRDLMNSYVAWVPMADFSAFRRIVRQAAVDDIAEIRGRIDQDRDRSRDSRLTSLVAAIVKPLGLDDEQKLKLKNILSQHPLVQKALG